MTTWTKVEGADPRKWEEGEIIEGILTQVPVATNLGSVLIVHTNDTDIVKFCPSRLYGAISEIPILSRIKIECLGKQKEIGSPRSWHFSVWKAEA